MWTRLAHRLWLQPTRCRLSVFAEWGARVASLHSGRAAWHDSSDASSSSSMHMPRKHRVLPTDGPTLEDFLQRRSVNSNSSGGDSGSHRASDVGHAVAEENVQTADPGIAVFTPLPVQFGSASLLGRKVYIETYGCQMNFSDTEIVQSILRRHAFEFVSAPEQADIVFLMTCAIRENAEERVRHRLNFMHSLGRHPDRESRPIIGVLGCMAERLKQRLLHSGKGCDLVVGPDAYRTLPELLARVAGGEQAVNVVLSADETYADIEPVRSDPTGVSAYVSIMRGCNNMCSFCIVPFTRGRERSRPVDSILREIESLSAAGYREVTLLGQNVNSYVDLEAQPSAEFSQPAALLSRDMKSLAKVPQGGVRFAELLDRVARIDPEMRIRFTSPHPQYFPDALLEVMRRHPNVCKQIHLPAQSGSTSVLERMRRGYSREAYDALASHIRSVIPAMTFSTDMIAGFCGETEAEHQCSVDLMARMKYENAFLFAYSLREKTHAYHHYKDDVPPEVKQRRLSELIETWRRGARERHAADMARPQLVLVEGRSRKADVRGIDQLTGRTDANKRAVLERMPLPGTTDDDVREPKPGEYVQVEVTHVSHTTLYTRPVRRTTLQAFAAGSV